MHINPPENPVEDRIIDDLDRGISPSWRNVEMENIRANMRQRERLKFEKLMKSAAKVRTEGGFFAFDDEVPCD